MPIPLSNESAGYYMPHCRCSANILADSLKISPLYKQQDSERWNAAASYYQGMRNNREQCCTSPPNSPVEFGSFGKLSASGQHFFYYNKSTSSGSVSPRLCMNDARIALESIHQTWTYPW
uniref:Uncharacterized protein n=1 Tax=Syphacia muris TaxID=451379 RepID=A0A158R3V3_9BILA